MEKVSIIIPTYNRKEFVRNAIVSALKQTYANKEIIVVDDHSTYDVSAVLQHFMESITLITNEKNIGCAGSFNNGISASSGEYLTFLGDDDIFHPKKIERQMNIFKKNNEIGVVYCPIGSLINNEIVFQPVREEKNRWIRLQHQNNDPSSALFKKECFSVCGVFDTSLSYHEDLDMLYRIGKKFLFGFDIQPSYIVYNLKIPRMSSDLERIYSGKKALYEKHKHDFDNQNKYFSDYHYELAHLYLLHGQYTKFFEHFKKSMEKNPGIIKKYFKEYPSLPLGRFSLKNQRIPIDTDLKDLLIQIHNDVSTVHPENNAL